MALFFAFMCGLGVMLPFNPPLPTPAAQMAQTAFFGGVSVVCLLGAVLAAWWMLQARMETDSDGLRWRGLFGWKLARWEEVRDYYTRLPSQSHGQKHSRAILKTARGSLSFGSQWTNLEALREQTERLATQAAAQEWGIWGSRPCDPWPRVFRYDTWQNIWTPRLILALILPGLIYVFARPLNQAISLAGMVSWPMKLGLFAPYLLLFLMYGGPLFLMFIQFRTAGRRKTERITADTHGIVFDDGARQVEASWADVTGYGIVHGPGMLTVRYVVETPQGGFDFLPSLSDVFLFKVIVQRYSAHSVDTRWQPRVDSETLGGEAARWSGGRVGVGARVYHYRTRSYRALLWLPAGLCLTMLPMAILAAQGLTRGGSALGYLLLAGGFGLVSLGGWYAYRFCRIETDEDGLTQITSMSRRRMAWGQVEDYWLTGEYNNSVVTGRGEKISFRREIVGYEELKEEISRRATECDGKAWERAR